MRTVLGVAAGIAIGGYVGYRIGRYMESRARSDGNELPVRSHGPIYGGLRNIEASTTSPVDSTSTSSSDAAIDIPNKQSNTQMPAGCVVCSGLPLRRRVPDQETSPAG